MKLASAGGYPLPASMFFITAQFVFQILLGAYFISKNGFEINYDGMIYGIAGGLVAAISTILFFLSLQQAPLSKVLPIVNLSLVVGVLLGVIFLKEDINLRIIAGILSAIMSIYLLTNSS